MPDNTEHLKSLLNDLINNRTEQAQVSLHDYFVAKTREVSGLGVEEEPTGDGPMDPDDPDNDGNGDEDDE